MSILSRQEPLMQAKQSRLGRQSKLSVVSTATQVTQITDLSDPGSAGILPPTSSLVLTGKNWISVTQPGKIFCKET